MRTLCLGLVLAGFAATAATTAIERDISDSLIDEAISVARRSRDDARSAFHRDYVFPTGTPPVSSVSIVTEFRRIVIAAEEQVRAGNRMWGLREARAVLNGTRNTIAVVVDLHFHPQNAYATVPNYSVRIIPKEGPEIVAGDVKATAKYGLQSVPSPSDPPYFPFPPPTLPIGPGAEPLTGAWVEASFNVAAFDPRALVLVAVSEGASDLARVSVDLGRIR